MNIDSEVMNRAYEQITDRGHSIGRLMLRMYSVSSGLGCRHVLGLFVKRYAYHKPTVSDAHDIGKVEMTSDMQQRPDLDGEKVCQES